MKNRSLFPILTVALLDAVGFSIVVVLLAYLAKEGHGASGLAIGFLLALKQILQIFAAPVLGRLSDRFGRGPLLILSLAGTVVSYTMLVFADSLWMLFLSRVVDGISGGNYAIIQATVSDLTEGRRRARGLGLSGAMFGLGFIIGPVLGFLLLRESGPGGLLLDSFSVPQVNAYSAGFLAAALFSLAAMLASFICTHSAPRTAPQLPRLAIGWRELTARFPRAGYLLLLSFAFFIPLFIFDSMLSLFLQEKHGLPPADAFRLIGMLGLAQAVSQAFIAAGMIERLGGQRTITFTLVITGLGLLFWPVLPAGWIGAPLLVMAGAGGITNTALRTALSNSVGAGELGTVMGMQSSVSGIARLVAPLAGGLLIDMALWMPGIAAGFLALAAAVFSTLYKEREAVRVHA